MKFSTIIPFVVASAVSVSAGVIQTRDFDCLSASRLINWYQGKFSNVCYPLIEKCIADTANESGLWHKTSCVAAATCHGPNSVYTLAACKNTNIPQPRASTTELSTNIFKNIVGSGSAITSQNYIDFIYGALSAANSTAWPASGQAALDDWFAPLTNWTATGQTVPYKNFNDFLHYADLN